MPILLLAFLACEGCGHRRAYDGIFSGSRIINTSDPAFSAYYRKHPDDDASYVPPKNYTPARPQPAPYRPNPYYANPTDLDAGYVPPRQPVSPLPPALRRYYANPTDNDAAYVPPRLPGHTPPVPANDPYKKYHDNDEEYYPTIYDY